MYFLGETQEPLQLFYSCFVFLCTLFFLMYLYGRFYGQRRSTNKIPYSFSRSGTQMHICEPHECALGYMTAKGGIYMALKKKKGLKLKMTDDQDGNKLANLEVWRREDKFAFCYKYKDSERYLLFEEDGELKFTQMKQNTDAAIKGELKKWNYWFEIKNNGTSHDSIQTAVSQKYLHLEERERCATLNDMLFAKHVAAQWESSCACELRPLKIRRPCRRPRPKHHTLNSKSCQLGEFQLSCSNGICTPHKCATTFLKNKSGKYVTLSKRGGLKLVARDTQSGAITSNLEIWKWDTKIAFCFKYESEIYLVTESEQRQNELELKLITDDAKQTIQNLHPWFEMENAGDHHYCIHTASSKKYLTIDTTKQTNSRITLSENQAMESTFCTPPCQCNEEGCPGV